MPNSIIPWADMEGGRRTWIDRLPLNWIHYQVITLDLSVVMDFERTIRFPAVEADEEADLPALPESVRTDTWTASVSGTLTWNRDTRADEVYFTYQGIGPGTGKFRLLLTLDGSTLDFLRKVWNYAEAGANTDLTGSCSQTVHSRSLDPEHYGEISSENTTGTTTATWSFEKIGVLETWLKEWVWAYYRDSSGSGLSVSADGPGLPVSAPIDYDSLISTHTTPPGGTPITLSSTATTEVEEVSEGDWNGTATTDIEVSLKTS